MLFIDTNIYTYVPVTKCRGDSKHKHQKVPMYRYWKLSVIYFIHCVRERKQALHVLLTCWHYTQLFHFPLALLEINKSTYQIALFLCCPLDNPTAPSKNKYLNLESRWGWNSLENPKVKNNILQELKLGIDTSFCHFMYLRTDKQRGTCVRLYIYFCNM